MKIEAISSYPAPRNPKELKQFLGLSNYYRRFIAGYSKIAEPLYKLLRKNQKFSWDTPCQQAFESLKNKLTTPPILAYPDFKEPFMLYTDASDAAIAAVLSQIQDNAERAFWSRQILLLKGRH